MDPSGSSASLDAVSDTTRGETPQDEHEGIETSTDVVSSTDSMPGDETGSEAPQDQPLEATSISVDAGPQVDVDVKAHANSKQAATKPKLSMSSKAAPTAKSNGGPPTPIVKKIIASGTFGAGSLKSASSKPATTHPSTAKTSVAPAVKKSTTSSSAPSKQTMTSQPPPGRRLSIVPAKPAATSSIKPALSSSTNSKPISSARASVVSPSGSATSSASRPRASVSEGLKRAPTKPIAPASKPPVTSKSPPVRSNTAVPSRTNPSISSIREVKEDGKPSGDLQEKLTEVTESLAIKLGTIVKLEAQVSELSTSLETALIDVASKTAWVKQLELKKASLEKHLEEMKQSLAGLEVKQQDGESALRLLQGDLEAAKASLATHVELVDSLRAQIQAMEEQALTSQETLQALRASTNSDANVAFVEHEALLKARENLITISAERDAQKVIHAQALHEEQIKREFLEAKVTMVDDLTAQVASLKSEKEGTAGKLSELEVEVLELRETLENLEDERDCSSTKIKSLEEQLLVTTSMTERALEETKTQAAAYVAQIEGIQNTHKEQLQVASEDYNRVVTSLEALTAELASAIAANNLIKADALAAKETHGRKLEEAEQVHATKETEFLEKIRKTTAALEGQEALYNSRVDAVRDEHNHLLQEAFERAKHEAGAEHAQELQSLRASSAATIDQVQNANQAALDDLKSEHAASLNSEVARLEKTISTLKIDLRATQDDLVKAKSALDLSRAEIQNLTAQRDAARTSAASSTDASTTQEEATRLAQELDNTKDDLAAITEMLTLTKVSLTELSNNHSRELEEAALARADEVTKLQSSHDAEVAALAHEKSELLIRLSDLEGELSTLKATITVESVSAKNNGNGITPPSPGITKEELQRMHEAHNLKIYDLQAEHQKVIKALREELEGSDSKLAELEQEVARKAMEIQYLEQDQEENQEQITRLREDINSLTEPRNEGTPPA